MEQQGYLKQEQAGEESIVTPGGKQAEGPSRHEPETVRCSEEAASSTEERNEQTRWSMRDRAGARRIR